MEKWNAGPAYRIETNNLTIRCYSPSDADPLAKSVLESVEHLKPWMPWAHDEPEPIETKINRLRYFRANFDLDKEYVYGIFNKDETELIGGCGLHPRVGVEAMAIGYWINVNHVKKGFGAECAGVLTKIGFEINSLKRIEIHCDPNNVASASIPRKLGFTLDAVLPKRTPNEKGELRDSMVWSIFRDQYTRSKIHGMALKAYNAIGNQIL